MQSHPPGNPQTRKIGRYTVLEQIGSGGMGEVFSAVRSDGQFEQKVAIKLVRAAADSANVLNRFRNERQILASLDHPNIARLLDGGSTEEGIPFLAMELVSGSPVDLYCDKNKLSITRRLELFRQICSAVQYAHQHLVVHRDIKPANILVTEEGIPKLLDFGIAKLLDATGMAAATMAASFTPDYASPEQLRGEAVSTSSDVYSLAVVLFRLLTGRSPYRVASSSPAKLANAIALSDPERPSTRVTHSETADHGEGSRQLTPEFFSDARETAPALLQRRLQGDLDFILLKALRKEPEHRYGSVEQFSEDIRKHLAGVPVSARKGTWNYRAGKFVRRNKAAVAAAGLVAATLIAGLVVTSREARIAEANRRKADARFNDVRKLANSLMFEIDDAIRNLPGSTPSRALVVQSALEYLDGLAPDARGDSSLQIEIASAYKKVGEVQGDPMFPNLGDSKGALESFSKALTILEALSAAEPQNQQVRLALASTHQQVSDVLDFSGDTTGAVEHSGKALRLYESLAPNMANDPKFQTELVAQTYHYANLLKLVGSLDDSVAEYGKAIEISKQIIATAPSNQEGQIHLATSLDGLGNVLQEKGDTAAALENRREGLAIREELVRLDPNNAHYRRQLAFSYHNVGLSLVESGDVASALANFKQELSLFESLSAADPKDVQARRNRSLAHKQIGDAFMRTGDLREALAQYHAALAIDRDLVSADPGNSQAVLDLSFSESKVGSALGKLGQTQQALIILRSGIARQEFLAAKDPQHILLFNHLANSYTRLANCLLDSADTKAAVEYYRKAVAARLTLSEKSPNSSANRSALAECYANLAKALRPNAPEDALKQYANAIELLKSLAATDKSNTQHSVALADASTNMARIYVRMAAKDAEPSTYLKYWTKARSSYQLSHELWFELSRTGKLPPARRDAIQEASDGLARCDEALAKLQPTH